MKGNRPALRAAVEAAIGRACAADFEGDRYDGHASVEDGHGRHEERHVGVVHAPGGLPSEWPDAAGVVQVNREREVDGIRTTTSPYYLSRYRGTGAEFAA